MSLRESLALGLRSDGRCFFGADFIQQDRIVVLSDLCRADDTLGAMESIDIPHMNLSF